jgi:hypothetical protein
MHLFLKVNFASFGAVLTSSHLKHASIDCRYVDVEIVAISGDGVQCQARIFLEMNLLHDHERITFPKPSGGVILLGGFLRDGREKIIKDF